jgi:hypothetical protein
MFRSGKIAIVMTFVITLVILFDWPGVLLCRV